MDELDELESHVEQVVVPLSYTDELYALRSNIGLSSTLGQKSASDVSLFASFGGSF